MRNGTGVTAWGAALRLWVLPAATGSFGYCPDHTRPDKVFCVTKGLGALVEEGWNTCLILLVN